MKVIGAVVILEGCYGVRELIKHKEKICFSFCFTLALLFAIGIGLMII